MRSVVLPFKDQASADIVRVQLKDFSQKIYTTEQPVYVSQKIEQDLKLREAKLSVVKQQCLVYKSQCDLCDAGYVGFTRRHLHQLVQEHRRSTLSIIGKHFTWQALFAPRGSNKFDFLLYEMLFERIRKMWSLRCK